MTPQQPGRHIRNHGSVLAPVEKRALIWIAERLPRWINSDHLSGLSILAMAGAAISFAAIGTIPWAAFGVVAALVVNWFGDSLDGTVARVRNQQRPRYGYYVDHVIDLAGTALLLSGLALSGSMSPSLAWALLAAYFLVSAESYLATHAAGVFNMSFLGFGPTELRIVIAAGAIKVANSPWIDIAGRPVRLFDLGGAIAIAGLILAFLVSSARNTRALYLAEPLPVQKTGRAA